MSNFLSVIGCVFSAFSIVVAVIALLENFITTRKEKRYWAEQKRIWALQRRSDNNDLTKSQEWLTQHNAGPNPCCDEYPDVLLRDFSDGLSLVVSRKEAI